MSIDVIVLLILGTICICAVIAAIAIAAAFVLYARARFLNVRHPPRNRE